MQIVVQFDGYKWLIQPDPAVVHIGTPVEWVFQFDASRFAQLKWSVYFDHGSPFGKEQRFETVTVGTPPPGRPGPPYSHSGTTQPANPEAEGDYKYGVDVSDPNTKQRLSDDDPWLLVRP